MLEPQELLLNLINHIPRLKADWYAKECIMEMKEAHYRNWKQTEWVGFYLEYLTENINIPGVANLRLFVGHTTFNGCAGKNVIDYKTSSSDSDIILNDQEAMSRVVQKYRELGYVILKGDVIREEANELDLWRQSLTGKSPYVIYGETTGRRHRKLKVIFAPVRIIYIPITKTNIKRLKTFNQGVNSDGNPRNPKYILPNALLHECQSAEIIFSNNSEEVS